MNTTIAARYISTFNLFPKSVNKIASILLQKKPEIKILKSNSPFNVPEIPPKTESNAAIIAIAIVTKNERDRDKRIRILNSTRIKFK